VLEGQEQGDHQHGLMGVYELLEGKMNGRGVWQMPGGQENFMYYDSTDKEWWINTMEHMMGAGGAGLMKVASTALTPAQVTETWKVADASVMAFVDAPKVRARVCSAEEKRAIVERLEQERQQAMAAARGVRDIRVEGQEQGDHQHSKMGVYELVEGKEVNGRGVWQMAGGQELFMYYAINKEWFIGTSRASMEAGKTAGGLSVASSALIPAQVTETWQAVDESVMAWVDAPKVRARHV
jgi:hypothetical protein